MYKALFSAARTVVAVIVAWWLIVILARVPAYLLPAPDAIASRFLFLAGNADLGQHIRVTLGEVVIGFLIGGILGVALGWGFVRLPRVGRLLSPLILLLQTAPKIAIAPLLLLWLGIDMGPKVTLIAIVTFFPVMAGAMAGFSSVETSYRDLAILLKLSPWQRFRRVELPFSLPPIFAGLRIGSTQAVTAAVVGELMGATYGLGYLLSLGQENGDASVVIVAILLLSTMGWAFHELIRMIERRALRWHVSQRSLEAAL
ncbi:ABC transporter permease [Microvirga antarctica]|uniref:ABC transporter permease n=1 Tax=Microvirga antarctica TaxID=2819233 RepID=UPI001B30AD90|nr:ABC transporter permease [Microvirga antarctica]